MVAFAKLRKLYYDAGSNEEAEQEFLAELYNLFMGANYDTLTGMFVWWYQIG